MRSAEDLGSLSIEELRSLHRKGRSGGDERELPPISVRSHADPVPLSFTQERLWLLEQLGPLGNTYNVSIAFRLQGALDVSALSRAFAEVVRRHEALRTRIRVVNGEPRQLVGAANEIALETADYSALAVEARKQAIDAHIRHTRRAFDLSNEPLLRTVLIASSADDHLLLIVLHHIISDGWSEALLLREICALYEAFSQQRVSPLAPLQLQYADYAIWQRQSLRGEPLQRQLQYWTEQLRDAPPFLDLPTDRARPAAQSFRGGLHTFQIDETQVATLNRRAREEGATLFMVILGALQLLLARWSGTTDVVVGSPLAGRSHRASEQLVGPFVNTVPLRTRIQQRQSFRELLREVKNVALGAHAHQDLPFERLVQELRPERDLSRHPVFQVDFTFESTPAVLSLPGLTSTRLELPHATAKYDLMLFVTENAGGLQGMLEYASDLFDASTIEHLADCFQVLLQAIGETLDRPVWELPLLPMRARRQLLVEWNQTHTRYPREHGIQQLFADVAQSTPDAIAVKCRDKSLTYGQLDERSNQLAHHLRSLGVGPETIVGVCLERSLEMVVALLAILKAGGAYLPLDSEYPPERVSFMLEDAGVPIVLTQSALEQVLPSTWARLVLLDSEWDQITKHQPRTAPEVTSWPDSPAYVLYTSGSTGTPKAVSALHYNVTRLVRDTDYVSIRPQDVFLQLAPLSFDASTFELWGALLNGATLVLYPERLPDIETLGAVIQAEQVSILWLTAGLFHRVAEQAIEILAPVRQLLAGGDALSTAHVRTRLRAHPTCRLINGYGPTECTTFSACFTVSDEASVEQSVPIGRAIANARLYVLDDELQPVPLGAIGELFIAGEGLARGYLRRPGLTAERFMADPFGAPGERLYRSGDRVRYSRDGTLQFIGRVDRQTKIRGFRIEPGEIEAALAAEAGVAHSVVVPREDQPGDKRLIAYLVARHADDGHDSIRIDSLRQNLARQLPEHMMPAAFVVLSELPLTPNGKVDREALPAPELKPETVRRARTPQEEILCSLFGEVLGLESVGIDGHFFHLGGHSLLATRLVSRIRSTLGIELGIHALFESPTIRELARRLDSGLAVRPRLQRAARPETIPLSQAQLRLWFLWELDPSSTAYHVPFALRLQGPLDQQALRAALNDLVARHESLRTLFVQELGVPQQSIVETASISLSTVSADAHTIAGQLQAEVLQPFDLAHELPIRAKLFALGSGEHVLLLLLHHIASDGSSLVPLWRDLNEAYTARLRGEAPAWKDLPVQYADYTLWQRAWLNDARADGAMAEQLRYWRQQLEGLPQRIALPTDRPSPAVASGDGSTISFRIEADLHQRLQDLVRAQGVTLFMVLQAALATLLTRLGAGTDIPIGSPIAGRTDDALDELVGFFVNAVVMRTDTSGDPTFEQLLSRVRKTTLDAYAHQELPFDRIVDALMPARSLAHHPLFQVMLDLQNNPSALAAFPGLSVEPVQLVQSSVKFDLTFRFLEHYTAEHRPAGVSACLEYRTDQYDSRTAEGMIARLLRILEGVTAHYTRRLSELPILGDLERQRLIHDFNSTAAPAAPIECIQEWFEQCAQRTPGAIALIHEGMTLTYRELDERANQLAHRLQRVGIGPDAVVGICMRRSPELVVGFLGVLKAGGAYLPLDPEYPLERLSFMLTDAAVAVLLTQSRVRDQLPSHLAQVLELDTQWDEIATESRTAPLCLANRQHLAYVIYTSGSTGTPKGVMVSHAAVGNYLDYALRANWAFGDTVAPISTPFAFDATVTSLHVALMAGSAVLLLPDEHEEIAALGLVMQERASSPLLVKLTPVHLGLLQQLYPDAHYPDTKGVVVTGGDALPASLVAFWRERAPRMQWINEYGPTETAVGSTLYEVSEATAGEGAISIGRPISNTQLYVLDEHLEPVPLGVNGELFIGGASLARGYRGQPGLTAQRFVANPFGEPGSRLYRTGDLVRYRDDGNLEFVGRVDQQVKIRGYRVELEEIEAALEDCGGVAQAAVIVREDVPGQKRLAAYLVFDDSSLSTHRVREHLQARLPEYMVPAWYVVLDRLPLTTNGKVDRRALPAPQEPLESQQEYVAPERGVQETLAQIWADVLRVERVGAQDNFFELGGDSIHSIQVVARASRVGIRISVRNIFETQTVAELAAVAGQSAPTNANSQAVVEGEVALTPIQHWYFESEGPNLNYFNQSVLLALRQEVGAARAREALEHLIEHHDALRLRFRRGEQGWQQSHAGVENSFGFEHVDLSQLDARDRTAALEQTADRLQTSLNITTGPLVQAALFEMGAGQNQRLLIVIHHLVVDAVSFRILIEDLSSLCDPQRPAPVGLPRKSTSFQDWAKALVTHAHSDTLRSELAHWESVLHDAPRILPDYPDGQSSADGFRSLTVTLEESQTKALLHDIPGVYRTQINDSLLTAFVQGFASVSGHHELLFDLEGHGREPLADLDVSRTVGWFTSHFPVRLSVPAASDPGEALKAVKEQLRSIPAHGMGYGILRYLTRVPSLLSARGAPISFNYLGRLDHGFSASHVRAAPEELDTQLRYIEHRHLISVNASVIDGCLCVRWTYSAAHFRAATLETLAEQYLERLRALVAHCRTAEPGYTPSDFPLARVSQPELDRLIREFGSARDVADLYPLSPLQQGLLFHSAYEGDSAIYFESEIYRIAGPLDVVAFQRAWEEVLERHSVLRTAFVGTDLEVPLQLVARTVSLPFAHHDWRTLDATEQRVRLQALLEDERRRGFDFARPPLVRLSLVRTSADTYRMLWSVHHILLDGWSTVLLLKEVFAIYGALVRGEPPRLPPAQPYREYIAWLLRQDEGLTEAHWRERLRGVEGPTPLPMDRVGVSRTNDSSQLSELQQILNLDVGALDALARTRHLTLTAVLRGAWALLLGRYADTRDVLFGATFAVRPTELGDIESRIGVFINTLPVRIVVRPEASVSDWLGEVQRVQSELFDFQHSSLRDVQLWSGLLAGTPLFESTLVLQNFPSELPSYRGSDDSAAVHLQREWAMSRPHYPLNLTFWITDALSVRVIYDSSRFTLAQIEKLLRELTMILDAMARDPTRSVGELSLLSAVERQRLLLQWNATNVARDSVECIPELFARQARRTPEAIALDHAGVTLTYRELEERSNQLAHRLQRMGIGPDAVVGICIGRSPEMVVGLLGVLKAGGAYLPIDPTYPSERLSFMLEDAAVAVLLTHSRVRAKLPSHWAQMLELDAQWEEIAHESRDAPVCAADGHNLAYVIYTSGSTGMPKGVMISHAAAENYLSYALRTYRVSNATFAPVSTPFAFDATVTSLLAPLMAGGTVLLLPEEHEEIAALGRVLQETTSRALLVKLTPVHLGLLQQLFPDADYRNTNGAMVIGGEALTAAQVAFWRERAPQLRLINEYGPTETVVGCSVYEVSESTAGDGVVPIGRPIANTQLYVLDEHLEPVPVGMSGELYIGGAGLARGYRGQPGLTAQRFVADPFGAPGGRLYRTGDVARHREDGDLEFVGRVDQQVKVRGYRVELEEIEAALQDCKGVAQAAVIVRDDEPGDKRLVAYLVADAEVLKAMPLIDAASAPEQIVDQWNTVYDDAYRDGSAGDSGDFVGWNSSYSNQPIPREQMEEWLAHTVERINALSPQRILEIGCGEGLLLRQLAPTCARYVGTDFAEDALERARRALGGSPCFESVQLVHQRAADLDAFAHETFDTIVLNSVVQYFPDLRYLLAVLKSALDRVADGGHVFVGDVRHLLLLNVFHSSVEWAKATPDEPVGPLRGRIAHAREQDRELVIDPEFFRALPEYFPRISQVTIRLKGGMADNELTRYRYDVVLSVGGCAPSAKIEEDLDWEQVGATLAGLQAHLERKHPAALVVRGIPNRRLSADLAITRLLATSDENLRVEDVRSRLRAAHASAELPEAFTEVARQHRYDVTVSFTPAAEDGRFDVQLVDPRRAVMSEAIPQALPGTARRSLAAFANDPLAVSLRQNFLRVVREALQARLPQYMVPAWYVVLDRLPLTTTGKVDRRALPAPPVQLESRHRYVAPEPGVQQMLAKIWADVLHVERVGAEDNFFELGGDSIHSIQVVARASRAGIRITVRDIFEQQSIAGLAAVAVQSAPASAISQEAVAGEVPLTPIQHWYFESDRPNLNHFNQSVLLECTQELTAERVREALSHLIEHHDSLRLRFERGARGWKQSYAGVDENAVFEHVDLSLLESEDRETALEQTGERLQRGLNIETGPLLRAALFEMGAQENQRLLIAIHHLAVDAVSWRILIEDLSSLCDPERQAPVSLPRKSTSFREWAKQLATYAHSDTLRNELAHWERVVQSTPPILPADHPQGRNTLDSTRAVIVTLNTQRTTALLKKVPGVYRTQINDALLTALTQSFAVWTGDSSLLIDLEGHGREAIVAGTDVTRTVGWFTSIFPVRLELPAGGDPGDALKAVKEQLRQVPARGIGYGILRYLSRAAALRDAPTPAISFNYLGQMEQDAQSALFQRTHTPCGSEQAVGGSRRYEIGVHAFVTQGRLEIRFEYGSERYHDSTIQALADEYLRGLDRLITHCEQSDGGFTPSDFPLVSIEQVGLDRLISAFGGARAIADLYPVSSLQHGILFHHLYEPASTFYVVSERFRLRGALDARLFERAWQHVVQRHTILRTAFVALDEELPLQLVLRQARIPLEQLDWRDKTAAERDACFAELLDADRRRCFDLARPPLMRVTLIQIGPDEHLLLWSSHHLLFDGWSSAIVLNEMLSCYQAFARQQMPVLKPAWPYRDFIAWLQRQDMARAEAFWRQRLADFEAPTIAPLSHPSARAAADGMRAELSHRFALPLSAVEACARRCKVTANALVQAAWAILLARCSARDDVLFGVTVSGRPAQLHEIETRVGLFINTLPMRLCVPHERSVVSWLPEVQARQLELLDYQFTSLQSVQRWAGIAPGTSLFECELVFENFPHHAPAHGTAASDVGRLEVSAEGGITRPHYPLNLIVSIEGELRVRLIYDSERFDQTDVEQLVEHFEQLLNSIVSDPQQPIGKLSWLSPTRRRQLEGDWNRTARECAEGSIPALFTAQVKRAPAAIALSHRGTTLSYRELDERSNRLAHRLIDCGIGPETLIGVCMERSVEMVIAQLAILKAGAAYLPLDPADPVHRLACLLRDSGAALLLTRSSARADSPGPGAESLANSGWAGRLIDLDAQAKEIDAYPVTPSARNIDPHQLAYVMYTSGSTGAPKGVGVSHRNIARIIRGTDQLRVDERDVLLQLASATFDAATFEIWCTILNGAQLVLYPGERVDLAELEAVVRAERVSMLFLTAGLFNRVMDSQVAPLDTLRVLIAGGDVVSPVAARQRLERSPSCELINGYGPTEGTIFVTTYRVPNVRAIERTVPIGRPIANAQVYVLDANLDLVPPGIVGELYLGGLGLARGYHNRSGLTAERFIASPFLPGERLYRTGDLVRYLADGNLEFVARADRQVKIRGYRIEPAEIEAALLERPGVAQAVVLARTVSPPEKQLVAYVTGIANADLDVESLRAHLAARLPAYMQPSAVVRLAAMPLTAIGKIDRSALPVPGRDAFPHMPYEAPDGELEISLSRIWQDVLHVDSLSRHDNFFAIGGHSLSAMQVCARVRQMLERELPIRELFEHPTLRALAARIALTTAAAIAPIVRGSRERSLPLSDAQQRLWFLDRFEHAAGAYHVPCAVRLRGSLNRAALIRALDGIVARHEALRTVFAQENTEAVQIVCPPEPTVLTDIDLSLLSSEHRQQALEQTLTTELARAFDLGKGPLLRACLIRLHDTEHVLLITIHHISCDGWSLGVLLRELSVLYAAAVEDREASLPPMTIQYADYAIWQQQHLNEVVLKHPLQYWCEQLRDAPVLLELPADRPRPPMQSYRGGYARVRLEPPLTAALRELCRREAVTLFTVLLTGYAILLARLSAQSDLVIGVPIANRVKAEVEGLIGLFVNTLALRVRIDQSESSDSEGLTVRALLQSVSTQTIAAYTHQEVPFEQIVNALQPPRNLSHSPVFQVLFALQNAPKQPLSLPGLTTEPLGVADGKSKFDLSLSLQELGDRVEGTLNYATDLFDLERIERWVRHFECVLTAMTENVEAPVSAVPLLREAERARILREFSRVSDVRPYTQPVHRLFEEQVARAPAAIALVDGTREVTYAELNARANRLSKVLCERGVAAGDCVAVLMSRSVELVVAELAILKCGAAYVPIDPEFPRNRQAFIVQDCAARCGLTSGTVPAEQRAPLDWIDVDSLSRDSEYTFAANPTMTSDAEACAYVMYTSGSTGEPKGVRIAHRCIPRVVVDNGYATIEPDDCVAFCSNPAFDASTFEVWAALLNGARLVIVPQSKLLEPGSFAALLAEARVSVLFLSTGLFNQYAEQLASAFAKLRYLMFGGQAADPAIVRQLLRVGAPEHLLNGYGPTETTTFASSHTLDLLEEDTRSIPIGSPIAQTQIYILDAHRQPVPIGVRGELWIGGAGVTLGYLNRPELTQMRFVRDPFSADPAARMYRTGDFGCWRADGAIEYLGRNDTQVKIRGFRIELQEIEAQLTRHDQVREAVVLAHEGATYTLHGEGREAEPWADSERAGRAQPDGPNEKRLVAYVVPRDSSSGSAGPSVQSLRAHLSGILPEYMIPSVFVTLDHLPLTPNGKLDRQALPTPEQGAHATHEYERPQGEVEQTLAQIWQELLRVERVGRADHFFELGGHSLLAMKLIVRVAERLDTQLSVVAVFQRPTLRPLAQWIERRRPGNQEWLAPSSVNFEEGVI